MRKKKEISLRKLQTKFKKLLADLDYYAYLHQNLDLSEAIEMFYEETGLTLKKCFEILRKSWQKKGRRK